MTRKKFITTAAIVSALILAIPFVCNEKLMSVNYEISAGLSGTPVKAVFISDLHNTRYGSGMSEIINAIDRFTPDIVIFGGDFFDYYWGEENSVDLAARLAGRYKCVYSLGNHEFKRGQQNIIKENMSALGVTILDGKYTDVGNIRFIGIDGPLYEDQLNAARSLISDEKYNVLISHYPEDFPAIRGMGFDLILSGHAHGGQWRFPPFINGVYSPGEGIFPKYAGGLYDEYGTKMIVSRGLQRCPRDLVFPRIFNRPELVFIRFA